MSTLEVSVSRYSLTVDTAETLDVLLGTADNESGPRLLEALDIALRSTAVYAVPADHSIATNDGGPDSGATPDTSCLSGLSAIDVLVQLESAGYLTARTELCELSSTAYLSDGRVITAVHVVKPFVVTCAENTVTHRTDVVPEGWYLVAEIDDVDRSPELVGVAGFDELSDDVVAWLYELEGFGASTCLAGCERCGGRWRAECGSWEFDPDESSAEPWFFDNADDFQVGTIACPRCHAGRVGFFVL